MTAHYSVAQVVEIREALEKITDEKHANNVSLASIIREAKVPPKVPPKKNGPKQCWLQAPDVAAGIWRARQDLNPRPPGS
jgi:hypothetical protein